MTKKKFSSSQATELPEDTSEVASANAAREAAQSNTLEVDYVPSEFQGGPRTPELSDETGQVTGPALRRNYGATVYTLTKGKDPELPKLRLAPGTKVSRDRHREGNMGAIYVLTGFHGSRFALKLPKDFHGLLALESELKVCKTFLWKPEPSAYFLPCVGAVIRTAAKSSSSSMPKSKAPATFWANSDSKAEAAKEQQQQRAGTKKSSAKDTFSLVKITADFTFRQSTLVGLVYPFCRFGTLGETIRRGTTIPVVDRLADLLHIYRGLRMLHENGITHDDLHADNIMRLDEFGPKRYRIIDFGNSHCNFSEWTDYDQQSFEHISKYYLFKDSLGGRFPGQRTTWASAKPQELRSLDENDRVGFFASKAVAQTLATLMQNFSDFDRGEALLKALIARFQNQGYYSTAKRESTDQTTQEGTAETAAAESTFEDHQGSGPTGYYHGDGTSVPARVWHFDNEVDLPVSLLVSRQGLEVSSPAGRLLFTVPLHMMPFQSAKQGFRKQVGVNLAKYSGKHGISGGDSVKSTGNGNYHVNSLTFPWYSPPQPTDHGLVQGAPPGFGRSPVENSRLVLFFQGQAQLDKLHKDLLLWGSSLSGEDEQVPARDAAATHAIVQATAALKAWASSAWAMATAPLRSHL